MLVLEADEHRKGVSIGGDKCVRLAVMAPPVWLKGQLCVIIGIAATTIRFGQKPRCRCSCNIAEPTKLDASGGNNW